MFKWLVVAVLVACQAREGSKSATRPAGSGSGPSVATPGSGVDPWVPVDALPPTPEQKKKRAEEAVARVTSIEPVLAKLRELPLKSEVPAQWQSTADFKAFLEREVNKEMPPAHARDLEDALVHIGMLEKRVDLPQTLVRTMVTQAAAYYDPAQKKFFVVMAPDSDSLLDTMSAHELTHALQDQSFDLEKYLPPKLDEDQTNARHFVVEGDATFAMFVYTSAASGGSPAATKLIMDLVRGQVEATANMDIAAYAEQMKQQAAAFTGLDEDMRKSMESIGELPLSIIGPLIDSYMKGAVLCMTAYDHGGWKAVDELYKNPPESTEQVLHPATKMFPTREHPRKVTLPAFDGALVVENVMGELQWANYFAIWKVKAPEAAVGWGGDRYRVVRDKAGHLTAVMVTAWDSENDATEFYTAYVASLDKRFPGADKTKPSVKKVGDVVYIVDGASDPALLDRIVKGAKVSKP